MQRAGEELVGRCDLDDPAEVHHRDAIRDVADDREIVGDEHVGEVELALQLDQQVQHLRLDRDVERGDRLVRDDELRLQHEGPREPDALPLAATELVRVSAGRLGRHADALEHLVDGRVAVLAGSDPVDTEAFRDQVADLHPGVERADGVLEDDLHVAAHPLHVTSAEPDEIDAVEGDLPLGRLEQAQQRAPEGGLAATGLPDEPEGLSTADLEVDAVDRLEVAGGAPQHALLDREVLLEAAQAEQHVVVARVLCRRRLRPAHHGPRVAHEAAPIGWISRGPFSHSQQADSCAPTSNNGGSSVAQRSKA